MINWFRKVLSLSQERIDDIVAKLSKAIEDFKSLKDILELLQNNIEQLIQGNVF